MKIAIIGQGYVGLPLAMAFIGAGHEVVGFDNNQEKITSLLRGESYIDDIDSKALKNALESGRYKPTSEPIDIANVEVAIIAVPTPLNSSKGPDLGFLESACDLLSQTLMYPTLVINESTSYPGTLRKIISKRIEDKSSLKGKHTFAIAPERVDPGNPQFKIKNTPRLIAGLTPQSADAALNLYKTICDTVILVSSPEVAEAAKIFENSFRQVNIALVNEFATIMQKMNIPAREVLAASETKPYGFMKFDPGIGVGGHCIPVDPIYLAFISEEFGIHSNFINLATKVNQNMPGVIVEMVERKLGFSLRSKKILVVGISYKSDIADVRESPSLELIKILREKGNSVSWHDSIVETWESEMSSPLLHEHYDITLVAVKHQIISEKDIFKTSKIVLDLTGKCEDLAQLI